MSIEQFPDNFHIKTFDNGEEVKMGGLTTDDNGLLGSINTRVYVLAHASLGGSETLTMKLYPNSQYDSDTVLATSTAFDLSDISYGANPNWYGTIRLDFTNFHINKNSTYYASLTVANYTRTADTFYIGVAYDWPQPRHERNKFAWFAQPSVMEVFLNKVRIP